MKQAFHLNLLVCFEEQSKSYIFQTNMQIMSYVKQLLAPGGPMLAPWTLLSGGFMVSGLISIHILPKFMCIFFRTIPLHYFILQVWIRWQLVQCWPSYGHAPVISLQIQTSNMSGSFLVFSSINWRFLLSLEFLGIYIIIIILNHFVFNTFAHQWGPR